MERGAENQLQRRNDLIPTLVETVKGVAGQEQQVFTQIAESRAKLAGAKTPAETMAAAYEQSSALARLLVVVASFRCKRVSAVFCAATPEQINEVKTGTNPYIMRYLLFIEPGDLNET